nr:hypothetical protein [Tanacetum cinerariifolium]GEX21008.1 hypothetical protein [Tanacetum cinerariifolium]
MWEEVQTCRNQIAQLNALIAKMEAFDDPCEVFDTLMGLRDDVRVEDAKLMGLNDLIAQADAVNNKRFEPQDLCEDLFLFLCVYIFTLSLKLLIMVALYILDKLTKVVGSSRLYDKMKIVFMQARGSDDSFIALMRDLCSALRVSIAKNRRLIAELEALGQRAKALKPLDYMKGIVGRDAATLGVLEQLLAASHVGMRLKDSYVAEMKETD